MIQFFVILLFALFFMGSGAGKSGKKGSFGPLIAVGIIFGFLTNMPVVLFVSIAVGILYAGYWIL